MTDSCSPYQFKYNLNEAINYRGKTPDQCFGNVGDNVTIFGFISAQNAAQIDEEYEYHMKDFGILREVFGIDDTDRTMTKEEWKKGMSAWRNHYNGNEGWGYEPDLNPGGGAYHM